MIGMDMIEFYVRLFLNRLRELFSITKLYLKCLDTKNPSAYDHL